MFRPPISQFLPLDRGVRIRGLVGVIVFILEQNKRSPHPEERMEEKFFEYEGLQERFNVLLKSGEY